MREARVSRSSFDIRGFVSATMSFLLDVSGKEMSDDDVHSAIAPVDSDFRTHEVAGGVALRDFEQELDRAQGLFFPFSTTHLHGHAIMCADGRYYWLMDPWEGDEEAEYYLNTGVPDDDDEDEDELDDIELAAVGYVENFPMGESDHVGFLVRSERDSVVIQSAIAVARWRHLEAHHICARGLPYLRQAHGRVPHFVHGQGLRALRRTLHSSESARDSRASQSPRKFQGAVAQLGAAQSLPRSLRRLCHRPGTYGPRPSSSKEVAAHPLLMAQPLGLVPGGCVLV